MTRLRLHEDCFPIFFPLSDLPLERGGYYCAGGFASYTRLWRAIELCQRYAYAIEYR